MLFPPPFPFPWRSPLPLSFPLPLPSPLGEITIPGGGRLSYVMRWATSELLNFWLTEAVMYSTSPSLILPFGGSSYPPLAVYPCHVTWGEELEKLGAQRLPTDDPSHHLRQYPQRLAIPGNACVRLLCCCWQPGAHPFIAHHFAEVGQQRGDGLPHEAFQTVGFSQSVIICVSNAKFRNVTLRLCVA